jgi:hypothetical protein
LGARVATRKQAADYCNLSIFTFDLWVKKGILPGRIPGTRFWDLAAIDHALDKASGLPSAAGQDGVQTEARP